MLRASDPSSSRTAQALCVIISVAILTAANSQETTSRPVNADDTFIDEIVVRAQKRDRAAQDVPISMAVFTGGDLEALNLTNVAQVALYTPNLEWDQSFFGAANSSGIFIRGIGQGANFAEHSSDPGVGVYLDGVYIGRSVGKRPGYLRYQPGRGPAWSARYPVRQEHDRWRRHARQQPADR